MGHGSRVTMAAGSVLSGQSVAGQVLVHGGFGNDGGGAKVQGGYGDAGGTVLLTAANDPGAGATAMIQAPKGGTALLQSGGSSASTNGGSLSISTGRGTTSGSLKLYSQEVATDGRVVEEEARVLQPRHERRVRGGGTPL